MMRLDTSPQSDMVPIHHKLIILLKYPKKTKHFIICITPLYERIFFYVDFEIRNN